MGQIFINAFGGANGGFNVGTGTAIVSGGTPNKNAAQFPQVGGVGTTAKIFAQPANLLAPFTLAVPSEFLLEGIQFNVKASGWVFVNGTTPTVQFNLYSGTSLTPGSDTAVSALPGTPATLTTNAFYPFAFTATFQGDSNSGILQGAAKLMLNNVLTAEAAVTALTGIAFGTAFNAANPAATQGPAVNLVAGITFGVSNAANLAQLNQFCLEA